MSQTDLPADQCRQMQDAIMRVLSEADRPLTSYAVAERVLGRSASPAEWWPVAETLETMESAVAATRVGQEWVYAHPRHAYTWALPKPGFESQERDLRELRSEWLGGLPPKKRGAPRRKPVSAQMMLV